MKSRLPKVMQRLAGRPMLAHVIETARTLKPKKLSVVYGYGKEAVFDYFKNESDISWLEQVEQLGTGHAVKQAMPSFDEVDSVLVLYGDVPCILPETLQTMIRMSNPQRLVLLTAHLDNPTGYGRIIRNEQNQIVSIVEEKDANATQKAVTEINTGIMLIPAKKLTAWLNQLTNHNAQQEYYLTDIVAMAVAEGVEVIAAHPKYLFEIEGANHFGQLAELERTYQRYLADQLMASGVCLADAGRIDIRGNLQCGSDVFIDISCIFEGNVVLEDNVTIGPHCVLKNVTIGANTQLDAFCHLESAQVGCGGKLGPYARLRPGADLGHDVHIGNFVEVKNATVDDKSKINHLTYIGDADIGKNVNIGAGTITCNYDGAYKHRTVIEDNVFIGSATQLVAPVRVRAGATVGAGTTLTKEAPMGKLTLSRAKQTTVESWKRPEKK